MNIYQTPAAPCRGCGKALEQGTLNAHVFRHADGHEEIMLRHTCGVSYSSPVYLRTLPMKGSPALEKPGGDMQSIAETAETAESAEPEDTESGLSMRRGSMTETYSDTYSETDSEI